MELSAKLQFHVAYLSLTTDNDYFRKCEILNLGPYNVPVITRAGKRRQICRIKYNSP